MKPILLFCSIFLMFIGSNSCQKAKTVDRINSDVLVYFRMILSPEGPTYQIHLSTAQQYGCSNYWISNDFEITDNQIDLDIKGIAIPDICLTSIGPALAIIDIAPLAPGNYPFNIEINGHVNQGELNVTSTSYGFNFADTTQIQFPVKVTNLIPENTIWGNISYELEESESIATEFLESLLSLGCEERVYPTGNYSYFEIDTDGQIIDYEYSVSNYHQRYIFHYTGNSAALENLIQDFETTYGNSIDIRLNTSQGEYL